MKKICKVILAAAAIAALAVPAMAADKLIVKHSTNPINVLTATDAGPVGFNIAVPRYSADVSNQGALQKSQLHFSADGADSGGWLTSVSQNNFFVSSGAMYDAVAGGWVQKSADGQAIWAGSGAAGFSISSATGTALGAIVPGTPKFRLNYAGDVGIGTTSPKAKLDVTGGIRVNTTGVVGTCDINTRGTIWFEANASVDSLKVCVQTGASTYAWKTATIN